MKPRMPMPTKKLPTKLRSGPLLDAIFEIRFEAASAAALVLPGLLVGALNNGSSIQTEKLAVAAMPEMMRRLDPQLQFAPVVRLTWGDFFINIGEAVLNVACRYPYPGWSAFRAAILEVFQTAASSGIVKALSRCSMKYIDLIPGDDRAAQARRFDWDVRLGEHKLGSEIFSMRIEIPREGLTHVVQIINAASATVGENSYRASYTGPRIAQRSGAIVDIDSISNLDQVDFASFLGQLPETLDVMHMANKEMFFSCLRDETIAELGAEYDGPH